MLVSEELLRDLGADPRPICCGDWLVSQLSGGRPQRGNPLRHLDPEGADLAGADLERQSQPGCCPHVCDGQVGVQLLKPLGGEGMHAGSEQRPHLLRRHRIPNAQPVDAGQAGADPRARTFAAFGVVGGQSDMALLGGVQCGDLPGQIVIPRSGGQLVDAHRHTH
jgi:hypothetical protein